MSAFYNGEYWRLEEPFLFHRRLPLLSALPCPTRNVSVVQEEAASTRTLTAELPEPRSPPATQLR